MKEHDRIGLGQVIAQLRLVGGPGHDELGDVAENGRLDRGLVEEVGDQHRETLRHRQLLHRGSAPDRSGPSEPCLATGPSHASMAPGSATAKTASCRIVPEDGTAAASFGPGQARRGSNPPARSDRLRRDPGTRARHPRPRKKPEAAVGERQGSGMPAPARAAPARHARDDRLVGARWNSPQAGSTGGLSQKFKSGRTIRRTTTIASKVRIPAARSATANDCGVAHGASRKMIKRCPGMRTGNSGNTVPDHELTDQKEEKERSPVDPARVDLDLLARTRHREHSSHFAGRQSSIT